MDFYRRKNLWKLILLVFAILIGAATLFYTETFLQQLRAEEIRKANLWANAMTAIQQADPETDLSLPAQIIQTNQTIPVILTNGKDEILNAKNFPPQRKNDSLWMQNALAKMREANQRIEVPVQGSDGQYSYYVYYQNSLLLNKLRIYPIVLLVVISLFLIIAYLAFSGARKAEQDRVWTGLAKETAHQIGTPLSSLMGWLEILRSKSVSEEIIGEMNKDVLRLNTIVNRFSKIGSQPSQVLVNVREAVEEAFAYLSTRAPKRITFKAELPDEPVYAMLNKPLFEWVIENLVRNAIDAIETEGEIKICLQANEKNLRLEVSDTGRGIPVNRQKTIFRPGFSTKKRGWGLGLSLARRIIEEYHRGKIIVANSQVNVGTTFRITLKRAET